VCNTLSISCSWGVSKPKRSCSCGYFFWKGGPRAKKVENRCSRPPTGCVPGTWNPAPQKHKFAESLPWRLLQQRPGRIFQRRYSFGRRVDEKVTWVCVGSCPCLVSRRTMVTTYQAFSLKPVPLIVNPGLRPKSGWPFTLGKVAVILLIICAEIPWRHWHWVLYYFTLILTQDVL